MDKNLTIPRMPNPVFVLPNKPVDDFNIEERLNLWQFLYEIERNRILERWSRYEINFLQKQNWICPIIDEKRTLRFISFLIQCRS